MIESEASVKGRVVAEMLSHFTNDLKGDRIVEYIKLDDYNHKIKVILNCSKEDIEIEDEGINLFTNLYEKNILKSNGIIIKRICN